MRKPLRITTFVLGALLFCAALAHAQQTGTVAGRVLDQTGAALPGVTIDLVTGTTELTTMSDAAGAYRFERVPIGTCELTFRLINFTVLRRTASVANGPAATVDAVLTLSLNADVIVTGTATFRNVADVENPAENLVGIASAASQGAITAEQLEARPDHACRARCSKPCRA